MCEMLAPENAETVKVIHGQQREIVKQNAAGVIVGLATVTCPCGWERGITHMCRCLYCKVYFCEPCAEQHFGKTVEQYKADKRKGHE